MTVDLLERARIAASENPWLDLPIVAGIWAELMRRRRKDGRFLYPTRLDVPAARQICANCDTAEQRQELAIWLFFSLALEVAENPARIMLRRDFETTRSDLQATAETLRKRVGTMVQLGLRKPHRYSSEPELHYIDPLIVAAEEADEQAAQLGDRGVIIVERDTGNMREHAVAVGIATMCRWLFGRPVPAVVVGLVKILLDRDIRASQVRDWCAANCQTRSRALTRKKNKKPILRFYS